MIAQPITQSPSLLAQRSLTHIQHILISLINSEELTSLSQLLYSRICSCNFNVSTYEDVVSSRPDKQRLRDESERNPTSLETGPHH
jgi:hypothetical protein